MKYQIKPTKRFQKDVKKAQRRWCDLRFLTEIITLLADGKTLPSKNKDHWLYGDYENCRECHITPDWLLIYEISDTDLFLYLTRTGAHSDLF